MCCVMPPASPETTLVSRIASSRLVLPWSTWPMIVTTGARGMRSSGASSNDLLGRDLVGCARDRDLALELGADHLDGLVRERLRDADELAEAHHDLLDLGGRDAQRGCQVLDRDAGADGRGTRGRRNLLAALGAVLAATAAAALARVALRARGGGVDHDAAATAELRAALRPGDARAAGRIGACAVAAGRRPAAAGCGPLAALRACARPARPRRARCAPPRAPGDAQRRARPELPAARDAPRGWSGPRRAHALPRPRRRCRPAGARRPRRGGGPPLRGRARARGQYRLHAFSASGKGLYQGAAAPPAAPRTACQSPSGTLTRARKERFRSPCRALSDVTQASLGHTYAPRPGARPTASAPARVGVQRDELVLRAPSGAPAARAHAVLGSGDLGHGLVRRQVAEARARDRVVRAALAGGHDRRRSGRRARRRCHRRRRRSRPPPRRTPSRP